MTTGAKFVSIAQKRTMGVQDFSDRLLNYLKDAIAEVHRTAYGLDGVFGGIPITISNGGHGADRFQLDNDQIGSDGDGHFLLTDAVLAGRTAGIQFENALSVAQKVRYTITGNTAGLFRATINGLNHDFTVTVETPTQIRDALIALINGGTQATVVTAAIDSPNSFDVDADFPGDAFTYAATAPGGPDMAVTLITANVDNNYDVALHYAERPREVQINSRLGYPEYVSFEETVGFRDDPDSVTDLGAGVLRFVVDSVCEPFGNTPEDHTGRKCLVWKKLPGDAAITEALAVQELTVSFVAGQNRIQTSTYLGQTTPSVTASDYYVLLLGPTVNRQTDLEIEPAFEFIGRISGAGSGNTPSVFSAANQNDLASGFAVDLNEVTRLDAHGDLKIRVRADIYDIDEPQVEVQDSGGTTRFVVDEDGDQATETLEVVQRAAFGGALDPARVSKVYGDNEVSHTDFKGTDQLADTPLADATEPRNDYGTAPALHFMSLIDQWIGVISGGAKVRSFAVDNGILYTFNAASDGGLPTNWTKDVNGVAAYLINISGSLLSFSTRTAANNAAWQIWDSTWSNSLNTGFGANGAWNLNQGGIVTLGEALLGSLVDLARGRAVARHGVGTDSRTCILDSRSTPFGGQNIAVYAFGSNAGFFRRGLAFVLNAFWDSATLTWTRAFGASSGVGSLMLLLNTQPAAGAKPTLELYWRSPVVAGTWPDTQWISKFSLSLPDGVTTETVLDIPDMKLVSSGPQSVDGGNPAITTALVNTIVPKLVDKAFFVVRVAAGPTLAFYDGVNINVAGAAIVAGSIEVPIASAMPSEDTWCISVQGVRGANAAAFGRAVASTFNPGKVVCSLYDTNAGVGLPVAVGDYFMVSVKATQP